MAFSKRLPLVGVLLAGTIFGWQNRPAWPPPVQKIPESNAALPVDQALKTFFLPPGYKLEVVAAEPLVKDPIVVDEDADGRLYVIEMPAFAMNLAMQDSFEPICDVVILEDTNGDGKMDKRTVFMDKLVLPRAIKVLADGVLVAEPPNLWFARDTDGDGKADTKELVRSDFGRRDANIEHNANGLFWGMDNTINTSEHSYNLKRKNGKFEIEPGLVRGQWNVSMDDAGRIFRNWNEQPLFVDYVAMKYYARNPNLARTRGLYDVLAERNETQIWPVRPTPGLQRAYREEMLRPDGTARTYASSADPWIFRGDRLPKELYGNAFIADSPTNLVHRMIVDDDGAGRLKARDAYAKGEIIASTDERFRPVNLHGASDGTLYIVDMYRGVVQDLAYQTDYLKTYIKTSKLEMPVGLGRIYRLTHQSMKPGPKPALSKAAPAALLKALEHPNGWWRDKAQQLLVQRGDKSVVPELRKLALGARDWRTRLHALWTIDGLDSTDEATVTKALDDKHADVRANALRLSETFLRSGRMQPLVMKKMEDASWSVRRQLAASLGELPAEARVAAMTDILAKYGDDPVTVDIAISGLNGLEAAVLEKLLASGPQREDAATMLAAAVARSRKEGEVSKLLGPASDSNAPAWQRLAILRGINAGLTAPVGGGGGRPPGQGGGRRPGAMSQGFALAAEPKALTAMIGGADELSTLARQLSARLTWPGKPAPANNAPPLNAAEEKLVADGGRVYANFCAGCHRADGTGNQGGTTNLTTSTLVPAFPQAALRVVLNGKDGKIGLMPPLGGSLNDDQVAAVISYIRRSWGHGASTVSAADVKETRGVNKLRKTPWSDEELKRFSVPPAFGGRALN
jgi:mono/diheme cytochrome c family protein